jgi:hypothetical protein
MPLRSDRGPMRALPPRKSPSGRGLGLPSKGFEERPPRVDGTLSVRHAHLLCIARVGLVVVAEQHRLTRLLRAPASAARAHATAPP